MSSLDTLHQCLACNSTSIKKSFMTKTMMAPQTEKWDFAQCSSCQLVMLNPRVDLDSLSNFYQEFYLPYRGASAWGKYANFVEKDQKKIDKKRSQTVLKYTKGNHNVVLDVGCGKPTFLKELVSTSNIKGVGIDFSDHGWSSNSEDYSTLQLLVGEPTDVDQSIIADTITMWHYLEHDYHPQSTLNALLRNSHNDTRLIIEVPNHDSSTRRKYGSNWAGYHTPRHTGLYDLKNMELLLNNSGWTVIDKYALGTLDPYVLDWMSRMEVKGIDWSLSMESHFASFVAGKIIRPWYFFPKLFSQGFMTVIAEPTK